MEYKFEYLLIFIVSSYFFYKIQYLKVYIYKYEKRMDLLHTSNCKATYKAKHKTDFLLLCKFRLKKNNTKVLILRQAFLLFKSLYILISEQYVI